MPITIEVTFTPAEFEALRYRDLRQTVCVVFDVLRATSTMVTALANGATAVIPVSEIAEALQIGQKDPEVVLAGEREGLRIGANVTGGKPFDFGNSPREFTRDNIAGKTLAMTTTNGTRALRACANAQAVLIGSFLNLTAVADYIRKQNAANLLLICSGTHEQAAYEDVLAAGNLADLLWPTYAGGKVADSAQIARRLYQVEQHDLLAAGSTSRNARRLLSLPELRDDVRFCFQRDIFPITAAMGSDGRVRQS